MLIRRVEDRDGSVLFAAEPSSTRAISETTAFLMANMLADVINAGTGARARGARLHAAGRRQDRHDQRLSTTPGSSASRRSSSTGVWVGFDQPQTILPNGFASDVAVPLWATFMKAATQRRQAGVVHAARRHRRRRRSAACRASWRPRAASTSRSSTTTGELERRSMVYTEYFARGTEPTEYCDLHPTRGIFGAIAGGLRRRRRQPAPPQRRGHRACRRRPPATVGAPADVDADVAAAEPEPPKKKRGFWSRVFGVGKDDDDRERRRPTRNAGSDTIASS